MKKISKTELKKRYVEAGYADKESKWYWDKSEKAYCLPLKAIVLGDN